MLTKMARFRLLFDCFPTSDGIGNQRQIKPETNVKSSSRLASNRIHNGRLSRRPTLLGFSIFRTRAAQTFIFVAATAAEGIVGDNASAS